MLVHLSNTSPYVCDLNRGPIEEANRMASAPTKTATALLEQQESLPKVTRTPLKLLAHEEIPIDITATATTDINASLQPVWYTEQTIVDEQSMQQEDIASVIQEQQLQGKSSLLPRSTLPPIQSESPSLPDDDEIEELPPQPSLMHKSSTFTIESRLNDSEKENTTATTTIAQPIAPSDDSFRELEQLLGLGSGGTVRDSPKTNHDTLSLTVVTPTDIINSTSASLRMSIAPKKGTDSLPSSQEISTMPTIESIDSINPPSFLMDNTTMEEEPTSLTLNQEEPTSTTLNQEEPIQITLNQEKSTDSSEDETNFSFELNDFSNESTASVQATPSPAPVAAAVPAPMVNIRAPTCTDVAIRALLKPRRGGRISQPVKADSPLAQSNKGRSSAPISRMLRSSCRRISTETSSQNVAESTTEQPTTTTTAECFVPDGTTEFIEMVTVNEEDETPSQTPNVSTTQVIEETEENTSEQNITPPKPMMPTLSREYTYNTPKRRSSARRRSMLNSTYGTPMQQNTNQEETNSSMLNILLTKPTEIHQSNVRKSARNSPSIASKSMLNVLLTQPTETVTSTTISSPVRTSKRKTMNSPAIPSKSMLNVLLTQSTDVQPNPPTPKRKTTSIASKSMLGVLLTEPTEETTVPMEQLESSPSIPSKSMLGVLLTQPTENQIEETTAPMEQLESSPSIPSQSMLGILLTEPNEIETNAVPSPIENESSIASRSMLNVLLTNPTENVQTSTRQSRRSTAKPSPKVSINPLHSSTPSARRNKSLQIVSIGEEEQVSTIVPQQEIEIVHLNQTEESFQQATTTTIARTIEMGVQTTPSIDISTRRRFHTLEPQTTPIVQMNESSSSSLVPLIENKPITPLQTKVVVNLQRKVCFQLTPTTDARLAEKEKLEEALRGLKPDLVIEPTLVQPEPKQVKVTSAVKKATKPKRKAVAAKKTKTVVAKETPSVQKAKAGPTKRAHRKQPTPAVAAPTKRAHRKQPTPTVAAPTKRAQRKAPTAKTKPIVQKETSTKPVQSKEKSSVRSTKRTPSTEKPPVPPTKSATKRGSRKRTMEEVQPVAQTATVKRVRTSKTADLPPPAPKVEAKKDEKVVVQPVERQTRTRGRSANKQKTISESTTTTKPTARTSKQRLESVVEKKDQKQKKVAEEKPALVVENIELNKDQRQKIESLTVAGLKSRLNTHKADIPKGAKKADLVALLIQLETKSPQNPKPTEKPIPVNTTTMTTRRRKN